MLKRIIQECAIFGHRSVALILIASALCGCHQQEDENQIDEVNQPIVEISSMPFFSADELPESPKPPSPAWSGVLIQAESTHRLSLKETEVLIYGYYKLAGSVYPLDDDDLRIYAVDTATKFPYEASAGEKDESPDEPPEEGSPLTREDIANMVFSGYFNTDLVGTLRLPPKNAKYRIWASLGKIKSNEILIEIIVR